MKITRVAVLSSMRPLNEGGRWPKNIVVGLLLDYDVIYNHLFETFSKILKLIEEEKKNSLLDSLLPSNGHMKIDERLSGL